MPDYDTVITRLTILGVTEAVLLSVVNAERQMSVSIDVLNLVLRALDHYSFATTAWLEKAIIIQEWYMLIGHRRGDTREVQLERRRRIRGLSTQLELLRARNRLMGHSRGPQ